MGGRLPPGEGTVRAATGEPGATAEAGGGRAGPTHTLVKAAAVASERPCWWQGGQGQWAEKEAWACGLSTGLSVSASCLAVHQLVLVCYGSPSTLMPEGMKPTCKMILLRMILLPRFRFGFKHSSHPAAHLASSWAWGHRGSQGRSPALSQAPWYPWKGTPVFRAAQGGVS